jgi:hypothetical protein
MSLSMKLILSINSWLHLLIYKWVCCGLKNTWVVADIQNRMQKNLYKNIPDLKFTYKDAGNVLLDRKHKTWNMRQFNFYSVYIYK